MVVNIISHKIFGRKFKNGSILPVLLLLLLFLLLSIDLSGIVDQCFILIKFTEKKKNLPIMSSRESRHLLVNGLSDTVSDERITSLFSTLVYSFFS